MDAAPDGVPAGDSGAVEVLFCSTSRNVVQLDCRAAAGAGAGWPFMMRLGLPAHAAWSAAAERALMRWADRSAIVLMEIRVGHGQGMVRLSDGEAAVLLEVTGAGSVFH